MKASAKLWMRLWMVVMLVLLTVPAWSALPNPVVTGPIAVNALPGSEEGDLTHDYVYFTPSQNLKKLGYIEEEFFIEGTASRYTTPAGQTGSVISNGHPYKTRIVVRRPISKKHFNGVVLLEWQNVTAGYELDANWAPSWRHIILHGYAWVGVSAQRIGVHGNPPVTNYGLKDWSPIRYGSLDLTASGTIMDDSLCYDVFAQAAQAIRTPQGINPLGNLHPKMILAVGASQSAMRLVAYHNSIHNLHNIFDGYYMLVGGLGVRTDMNVKVFSYLSETDIALRPHLRIADSDTYRSWEVAATGHSSYVSDIYRTPLVLRDFRMTPWPPDCNKPPYSRVRGYDVINASIDHLVRWIAKDIAPPIAPKIEFESISPPVIARDEFGMALGGIRLPDVEAPIAVNTGINSGATFCTLYGSYEPFDDDMLRSLYRNHGDYVHKVKNSISRNLKAGFILHEAAGEILLEAARADIPPKIVKEKKSK